MPESAFVVPRLPLKSGALLLILALTVIACRQRQEPPTDRDGGSDLTPVGLQPPLGVNHDYVGSAVCRECHDDVWHHYQSHPMSISMAAATAVDQRPPEDVLELPRQGAFAYRMESDENAVRHYQQLLDLGGNVLWERQEAVDYVVGSGRRGKSYLVQLDALLFQSPLSWYRRGEQWDVSPGYAEQPNLSFSRRITDGCVACHAGRVAEQPDGADRFSQAAFAELAIGCERCHGPGAVHVAFQRGEGRADSIVNPTDLTPSQRDAVCYQCHLHAEVVIPHYGGSLYDFRPGMELDSIWSVFVKEQVQLQGGQTLAVNQVQQMLSSTCYQNSNGDLGCVSCHDPHAVPGQADRVGFYRDRCHACHQEQSCSAPPATREQKQDSCIDCHMPRLNAIDIPHTAQTDHRVLRDPGNAPEPAASEADAGRSAYGELFNDADARLSERVVRRAAALAELALTADLTVVPSARLTELRAMLLPAGADASSMVAAAGDDLPALLGLGSVSLVLRDAATAEAAWQRALQLDPHNEPAVRSLANLHLQRGDLDQATQWLEKLLEIQPYQPATWELLSQLNTRLGRIGPAISAAEQAVDLDPLRFDLRRWLVDAYRQAGRDNDRRKQADLLLRMESALNR